MVRSRGSAPLTGAGSSSALGFTPVFVAFPAWAAVRRYSNKAATVPICWDLVFNKRSDFVEKPFSRTAGTQLPEMLSVEF